MSAVVDSELIIRNTLIKYGVNADLIGDCVVTLVLNDDILELKAYLADCGTVNVDTILEELKDAVHSKPGISAVEEECVVINTAFESVSFENSASLTHTNEEFLPENDEPVIRNEVDWISLADDVETMLINQFTCQLSFSPEAVLLALSRCDGNVCRSCQLLLSAKTKQENCKPCRHLESGRCVRADCWFDHNLGVIPCRFWLFGGGCVKGTNCRFLHDLPPEDSPCISLSNNEKAINQSSEELWSFPALPVIPKQQNETLDQTANSSPLPPSAASTISQVNSNNRASSGITVTVKKGSQKERKLAAKQQQNQPAQPLITTAFKIAPVIPAGSSYQSVISLSSSLSSASSGSKNKQTTAASSGQGYGIVGLADELRRRSYISSPSSSSTTSKGIAVADWVSSGSSLRSEYQRLREEARQLAIGRNTLLQEATAAYRGSNKASARQLASRGQELNRAMHAAHEQAAKTLFRDRNPPEQLQRGIIDLHGLHISEARACLLELLPLFMAVGGSLRTVRIITGSGHHSIAYGHGTARLLPEVKRLCGEEMGLVVKEVKDSSGYASAVAVSW